ncbi:IS110 family transposase [Neosynechococcus sphagnicola]|uniref:IS110 family transposase n=1 Tax=Neosynechococcus sphagnicola TaxID=1501145 RepID=UPI001EF9F588|nr:IS110 family transposase [Neosynechococcus sphagnicola]
MSKDNVTCCLLTTRVEPRKLYLDHEFPRLYANTIGIKGLLSLKPNVAVLEPTGMNYTKIWVTKLIEAGVEVVLVGHKQLKIHRVAIGLPDKDDEADSLALADYYQSYCHDPTRFVRMRDPLVAQMRDLVLRLHHQARVQSPIINRLRQDLIWQYPEGAKRSLDAIIFWRWLAGEGKSGKYDLEYANTCGLGLTDFTRESAQVLNKVMRQELEIDRQLRECLHDARFNSYRQIMAKFGMGERVQALIISQIYPLQNYLENNEPIMILSRSKTKPGKQTTKHISERKFTKALGMSPEREWSGDGKKTKKSGSELCRTAMWQWLFTRVEVKRCRPVNLPVVNWEIDHDLHRLDSGTLADYFDWLKGRMPIKLARSKTCAKAVKALFYELVATID